MDRKSMLLTSFSLIATLALSDLEANTQTFLSHKQELIRSIQDQISIKAPYKSIQPILNDMQTAHEEFNKKVVAFLNRHIVDFVQEDVQKTGFLLANIAKNNEETSMLYQELKRLVKKRLLPKEAKKDIILLENSANQLKKEIQYFINISYMEIEAKNFFKVLKVSHENYSFNSYWYDTDDLRRDEKVLYVSLDYKDDDIFDVEDNLNATFQHFKDNKQSMAKGLKIPDISGFSFADVSKVQFQRVSII